MNSPLVSIIIPTYNRSKLLKRAIESALAQTYKNFEIIIVDDASTDNTIEVIRNILDNRIIYIKHETKTGGSAARNTGIKSSKGEYIQLLDDDDEILPTKIEKQIQKFYDSDDSIGAIYCGFSWVRDGKIIRKVIPRYKRNVFQNCLLKTISANNTFLIKKKYYIDAGLWDEDLVGSQDFDMWIRISQLCDFDYLNESLALVHLQNNQISSNLIKKLKAQEDIIKKYNKTLLQHPKIFSSHLKRLYKVHCLSGNNKIGFLYLLKAIRKNPLHLNSYIFLLFFIFPPKVHKAILNWLFKKKYGGIILY